MTAFFKKSKRKLAGKNGIKENRNQEPMTIAYWKPTTCDLALWKMKKSRSSGFEPGGSNGARQ